MRHLPLLLLTTALLTACGQPAPTQPVAPTPAIALTPSQLFPLPPLQSITWRHIGLHANDELTLRPDGTYTLIEREIYRIDPPGGEPANSVETITSTGRFQPVFLETLLLTKDKPDSHGWDGCVRVYRRAGASGSATFGFTTVATREKQIAPQDNPVDWHPLPDHHLFVYYRDLARYSDELDSSSLFAAKPYAPSPLIPADLIATVRAQLPAGWSATAIANTLIVARDKPIQIVNLINATANFGPGEPDYSNSTIETRYALILRLADLATPAQLAKLRADNAALDLRLEVMRNSMRDITHKFDSFSPSTPAQQRRVADYEKAKATRQPVPQFHTNTHAIFVSESGGVTESLHLPDRSTADIKQKVLALLQPY